MIENGSGSVIVCGTTGSGKSYFIGSAIHSLIGQPDARLVLIDPKMVELEEFRLASNCLWYADDEEEIYTVMCNTYDLMMDRYRRMKAAGQKNSDEAHVFIFIDEMAALLETDYKKQYIKMMSRIALMGRAARVHMVLGTQVATRDTIPSAIRNNVPTIVCLRQQDARTQKYLLDCKLPELPERGFAYVKLPTARPVKVETDKAWSYIMKGGQEHED